MWRKAKRARNNNKVDLTEQKIKRQVYPLQLTDRLCRLCRLGRLRRLAKRRCFILPTVIGVLSKSFRSLVISSDTILT